MSEREGERERERERGGKSGIGAEQDLRFLKKAFFLFSQMILKLNDATKH